MISHCPAIEVPRVELRGSQIREALRVIIMRQLPTDQTWVERVGKELIINKGGCKKEPVRLVWRESTTPAITQDERDMIELITEIFMYTVNRHHRELVPSKCVDRQLRRMFRDHFDEYSEKLGIEWGAK